jgi:bifunctional UDP-N-acetylglucosamine pyrophosphorylase/glucosamine-1-phosphate N-acetyltransferase
MLTARVPDPTGYGRVVRESDTKMRIVEHRDATPDQLTIKEVNVAVYLCGMPLMRTTVDNLQANNAQGELYLTEIAVNASKGRGVRAVDVVDLDEMRGVNDQIQLAEVDMLMRDKLVRMHQNHGVRFKDARSVYPSARLTCGQDVVIGIGVQFQGTVKLGNGVVVEGPSVLRDCDIGDGTTIEPFSHIDGAKVGKNAKIGPSARLRPGAALADDVHIGNFVEVKNTTVGKGAKANHLAYLGDADIGAQTNIGAGTITCNYDGVAKHRTTIGQNVFVGSNSTLVAPVTIDDQAYIAAGSTITKAVPAETLAFGRARQENRDGYANKLLEIQKQKKGS